MKSVLVVYDVPTTIRLNPCNVFRRIGVRINLSCWIVPEHLLPDRNIDHWRERGAAVEVVRFDESEYEKILRLARLALQAEVRRIRDSLIDSVARVDARLRELEPGNDDKMNKLEIQHRAVVNRARREVNAAVEAATAFDILQDVQELVSAVRNLIAADGDVEIARAKMVEVA